MKLTKNEQYIADLTEQCDLTAVDWSKHEVKYEDNRCSEWFDGKLARSSTDGITWNVEEWFIPYVRLQAAIFMNAAFESGY